MKFLKYILICELLVFGFVACEDSLDPEIKNVYDDDWVWYNADKAEGVLMNAYKNINSRIIYYGNNFLDVATDNAVTNNY